ncbi:MAG: PDZ domain-containing protein, partial [Magnetococcales bacterium]|nr:PDZ domain-containing protein [Magnetococcales bacterium]
MEFDGVHASETEEIDGNHVLRLGQPKHPDIAISLNDLKLQYHDIDAYYAKVVPFCQHVLNIQEQQLGPKHLDNDTFLALLSSLYGSIGAHTKETTQTPEKPTSAILNAEDLAMIHISDSARQLQKEHSELFDGAKGIVITSIIPDSQAKWAGLQSGDVVIAYGDTKIDSTNQFISLVKLDFRVSAGRSRTGKPRPARHPACVYITIIEH